jgi:hypothetical protein
MAKSVRTPTAALETLRDDAGLAAWFRPGTSKRLVVVFSDIKSSAARKPDFVQMAGEHGAANILFIADPARSWMNRPNLIEDCVALTKTIAARVGADDIIAMGASMGGYSAIVLAGHMDINLVVAFSPQMMVKPSEAPSEKRWVKLRRAIGDFRILNAADLWSAKTTYMIAFDETPADSLHRAFVPMTPNTNLLITPGESENAAQVLQQHGCLEAFLDLIYTRRFMAARKHIRETLERCVFTVAGY